MSWDSTETYLILDVRKFGKVFIAFFSCDPVQHVFSSDLSADCELLLTVYYYISVFGV